MAAGVRMSITDPFESAQRAWEARSREIAPIMRECTTEAVVTVYAEARSNMRRMIYDRPIPNRMELQIERKRKREAEKKSYKPRKNFLNAKGNAENREGRKPAWRRTGNLRRSERYRVRSPYYAVIYNDAGYAAARHFMRNTRYPAPWRTKAVETQRDRVRLIYRKGMLRCMRSGLVPGIGGL